MSLYHTLLRSLRRNIAGKSQTLTIHHHYSTHPLLNPTFLIPHRSFAFSSAEEAAAERRRRKRRLRIEPPINALRRDHLPRGPPGPDDPRSRLPDTTSALVGPRLNLHNRVQSLIRAGDLDSAAAVARRAVFSNTRPTVFTCNAIIGAMYRSARYDDAKALFQYFFNQSNIIPNVVSYNHVIVSHCESGEVDEGLKVYSHIIESAPFSPSSVTYRHLTKGLIDSDRISEAVDLLREMLNKGHGADSLVYNNLILGFLNLGNLEKANELFDELKERCTVYDGVVNATFMDWFFKQGKTKEAMESYRSLLDKKYRMVPATCNVLLEVLLKHGRETEAWTLFDAMLDDHTPPTFQAVNSDTISIMVNECFRLGKVTEALDTFKKVGKGLKTRPFAMDVAGYNNMITRLCELEMMEEAEKFYMEVCNKSLSPDVTTYRTMIEAYVKMDNVEGTLEKYTKMVEAGLRVIPIYAEKWFDFLIKKGKVVECVPILTKMGEREPKPDVTTYDILIRALCKEDNYDASFSLVGQMVNYGVGLTSTLREFLLEAFGNQGRREEMERLFATKPSYFPSSRPSGPPRMGGQVSRPYVPGPQAAQQGSPPFMGGQGSPQMQGQPSPPNSMWQQNSPPSFMRGQGSPQLHSQPSAPSSMSREASPPSFMGGQGSPQMQGPHSASNSMWRQASPPSSSAPGAMSQQTSPPSFMGGQGSPQMQGQQSAPNPTWQQASPPSFMGGQGSSQMQGQQSAPNPRWQQTSPPNFMAGQGSHQMQGQPSSFARNPQQASPHSFVPQQGAFNMQGPPLGFTHTPQQSSPSTYMAGQGAPQMQGRPSGFTQTPQQASPYFMAGQGAPPMQSQTSGFAQRPQQATSPTFESVRGAWEVQGPASAFAREAGHIATPQGTEKAPSPPSSPDESVEYYYPRVADQGRI